MVHRGTNYILKVRDENCCNETQYLILYRFCSKTSVFVWIITAVGLLRPSRTVE